MLGHAPEIIRILHDLVVGLCGKVKKLDAKISAMKKQDSVSSVSSQTDTTCGINPLHEHSAPLPRDVNSIGNGTIMRHCIMTSLTYPCNRITPVQQSHTSMICLRG